MSEYELAELALLQKDYATHLEAIVQGYVATLQTEANILLSMIFGYLLVAHFIGRELNKVQLSILNTLYLVTVASGLTVYKAHYESIVYALNTLIAETGRLASDLPIAGTSDGLKGVIGVYIAMIIASYYFMWSVRHQKNE